MMTKTNFMGRKEKQWKLISCNNAKLCTTWKKW
jgi:hypothetical protein